MSEELSAARRRLQDANEVARRSHDARTRADALDVQIAVESQNLAAWLDLLTQEQRDVDRYEGWTVASVLASIAGRREEKVASETAERDAVALELAVRTAALDRVREEVRFLRGQATPPQDCEQAIEQARTEYLSALHAANDPRGPVGTKLIEQIGTLRGEVDEVVEAQVACAATVSALSEAARALSAAGGWSTYDTFFGGGLVADSFKRDRIAQATRAIGSVHYNLTVLAAELRDVAGAPATLSAPQISPTLGAMDLWLDNIFSDWMVRNRISASKESVARTQERLTAVAAGLAEKLQQTTFALRAAESELATVLAS